MLMDWRMHAKTRVFGTFTIREGIIFIRYKRYYRNKTREMIIHYKKCYDLPRFITPQYASHDRPVLEHLASPEKGTTCKRHLKHGLSSDVDTRVVFQRHRNVFAHS